MFDAFKEYLENLSDNPEKNYSIREFEEGKAISTWFTCNDEEKDDIEVSLFFPANAKEQFVGIGATRELKDFDKEEVLDHANQLNLEQYGVTYALDENFVVVKTLYHYTDKDVNELLDNISYLLGAIDVEFSDF